MLNELSRILLVLALGLQPALAARGLDAPCTRKAPCARACGCCAGASGAGSRIKACSCSKHGTPRPATPPRSETSPLKGLQHLALHSGAIKLEAHSEAPAGRLSGPGSLPVLDSSRSRNDRLAFQGVFRI